MYSEFALIHSKSIGEKGNMFGGYADPYAGPKVLQCGLDIVREVRDVGQDARIFQRFLAG